MKKLLSYGSLVETPMIVVRIGEYTFGRYSRNGSYPNSPRVTFPNFMQSINITKINGAVNTYTISMVYVITPGNDPNLLDKVFGSVANSRKIFITYGDCSSPNFVFREEEATILQVTSNLDVAGSKITYNLSCVSTSMQLYGSKRDFPAIEDKPSSVIKRMLNSEEYGLLNLFYGMKNKSLVAQKELIPGGDKKVKIVARKNMSVLDYLNFLVSCMQSEADTGDGVIQSSRYYLTIVDDTYDEFEGPYFKITQVGRNINYDNSFDGYEIDVGYPGDNFVTGFTVDQNDLWTLLFKYSAEKNPSQEVYRIDNKGNVVAEYSPDVTTSSTLKYTTPSEKAWWTQVTGYPINATITIKGLLSPVLLMSYIRVNVYFFGQKHCTSGLYVVTKQVDNVDSSGYKTTLSLMRVGGDNSLALSTNAGAV